MPIEWSDFEKVDMRIGTIVEATVFPEARNPAYKLKIDFGRTLGIRSSSAQITVRYKAQQLLGKQVIAVVNFPPKQIGPFMSECLVLGAVDDTAVTLLSPDSGVPDGSRLS